ncbi:MAG: TetR/AcrR family transcriptional regulator [Terracidiphilus sp.]
MSVPSSVKPARPAGRPRSEESRTAILDAAFRSLQKGPVSEISTIQIARDAGVSTATVYRWWPTKEALLLDAVLNAVEHELILKTDGSPLERLKDYVLQVGRLFTGANGRVVTRLLAAIQDNAMLRSEFLKRAYAPRDKEFRAIVKEAIKRGDLPAEVKVGLFLDSIVGPLLARLLIRHERIDEPFVAAVFDQVVAGTVAQWAQGGRSRGSGKRTTASTSCGSFAQGEF